MPASPSYPPVFRRHLKVLGVLVSLAIVLSDAPAAIGKTYHLSPQDNWFEVIGGDRLRPGDVVVLHAGVYSDPRRLGLRHRGSDESPIVIRGAEGEQATFQRPDAKQNSLNLEGTRHLVLRNFEITGGAAGIRIRPRDDVQPEGIVLEGLHIHHVGGVAVTCNHPGGDYSRMTFRRNHIHHTGGHGEGFYLGGNNAAAIIHDSVIEDNYIHDLVGEEISQGRRDRDQAGKLRKPNPRQRRSRHELSRHHRLRHGGPRPEPDHRQPDLEQRRPRDSGGRRRGDPRATSLPTSRVREFTAERTRAPSPVICEWKTTLSSCDPQLGRSTSSGRTTVHPLTITAAPSSSRGTSCSRSAESRRQSAQVRRFSSVITGVWG